AQVGSLAPILLTALRLIQGFAIGGNWGGGLLLAVEYAPANKRGWYGAVPQTGALIGLALGNFAASFVDSILTDAQFRTFGWRIPFLLSIILVFVGFWVRQAIDETPSFQTVQATKKTARVPLFTTFKFHWRAVLITIGAKFIETSTFFLFATFTIS